MSYFFTGTNTGVNHLKRKSFFFEYLQMPIRDKIDIIF